MARKRNFSCNAGEDGLRSRINLLARSGAPTPVAYLPRKSRPPRRFFCARFFLRSDSLGMIARGSAQSKVSKSAQILGRPQPHASLRAALRLRSPPALFEQGVAAKKWHGDEVWAGSGARSQPAGTQPSRSPRRGSSSWPVHLRRSQDGRKPAYPKHRRGRRHSWNIVWNCVRYSSVQRAVYPPGFYEIEFGVRLAS